jgi:hypothetical protein
MQEFTPCSVCNRSPLVGEKVSVLSEGGRESPVCDLCLDRPRVKALGEIVRRDRIRSAAGAANVRREWPTPAAEPATRVAAVG